MRPFVVLAGFFAVVAATWLVVALVPKPASQGPVVLAPRKTDTAEEAPPISADGPYPKALIDDAEFKFGRMEVGEERTHKFIIRNEGDVPLVLKKGHTTCQCTVSELEMGEVAPGKSGTVTLTWKPTGQAEQFNKGADILTNDPLNKVIKLRIVGMVAPRLLTIPSTDWFVPDIYEQKPTEISGLVCSPVADEFQVVSIESKSPCVSAVAVPLEKSDLETQRALSGYRIQVTLKPDMPVGAFSFPLTIKTDLPGRNAEGKLGDPLELNVLVSGHRTGPYRIIGAALESDNVSISMGSFDAAQGKKVTLTLFVRGSFADELQLVEPPECTPAALKVDLEPDPNSKPGHHRYRLTFEYPAGSPPVVCRDETVGKVRLHTNHPAAPLVELRVFFAAL